MKFEFLRQPKLIVIEIAQPTTDGMASIAGAIAVSAPAQAGATVLASFFKIGEANAPQWTALVAVAKAMDQPQSAEELWGLVQSGQARMARSQPATWPEPSATLRIDNLAIGGHWIYAVGIWET